MKKQSLLYTFVGAIGLIISTGLVNMFFSTPPSRAEFSELKFEVFSIKEKLKDLKKGQERILDKLIKKEK